MATEPPDAGGNPALEALRALAADGPIVEEFRPLTESLEWSLGQDYWQERGSQAFFGDHVPFKITNDGNLARKAADLLFISLVDADASGSLEPRINVLEFGAGSGLFARYLLDAFLERCRREGRDYHERLTYFIAEGAPQMLDQLRANGVLGGHDGRWKSCVADAARPETWPAPAGGGFRAVFLNYVLDCLPAAIVRQREGGWQQLCVRTRFARKAGWRDRTELTLDQIRSAALSHDAEARRALVGVRRLFAFDLGYRSIHDSAKVPHLAAAEECVSDENGGVVLHNHGAIECLERLRERLVPGGFILVNDYADAPFDPARGTFLPQRFAGSSAIGLNLAVLAAHFAGRSGCGWFSPEQDNPQLISRLLARDPSPGAVALFQERFSAAAFQEHFHPVEEARAHVKAKRHEAALAAFARALEVQPDNWALLTEIADHLAYATKDYDAALRTIDLAIHHNRWWAEAWNTRGDCLYYLDRFDEAHAAFERALSLRPDDVRTRYNISFTLAQRGDTAVALARIAEALALDTAGNFRDRLLEKQREILAGIDEQRRTEQQFARERYRPPC